MSNSDQLSLDFQYKRYEKDMSNWEKSLSLPKYQIDDSEIQKLLTLTIKQIKELSSLQVAEYVYVLTQYSAFLQDQSNKCSTFLKWSSYSSKIIKKEDQHKFNRWVQNIEMRQTRLNYMSRKIEKIAESLYNICIGKNVERKYSEHNKQS